MILLTGATGNVGVPLVPLLSAAGVPFRAFVRDRGRRSGEGPYLSRLRFLRTRA